MNDTVHHFGGRVAKLRKRKKLAQADLAAKMRTSQATVSRVESTALPPTDTKLISELANALGVTVTDLLEGMPIPPALQASASSDFYAFCTNPFCHTNRTGRGDDGKAYVAWNSGGMHGANKFAETNYCVHCGGGLVKQCPSCGNRLKTSGTRYCGTCGSPVSSRPTTEEWKKIEALYPKKKGKFDDLEEDIPF